MAKLTKAQKAQIETALHATNLLIGFIGRGDIAFCSVKEINENVAQGPLDYRARESHRSQHYEGRDGAEWDINYIREMTPMNKGADSLLVQRYTIKKALEKLLEDNS